LRRRLTGGPVAAACDFADWAHGDTGIFFLDFCDEYEIDDNVWCREVIDHLTAEWHRAEAALDRIDALRRRLEADPARAFADLLRAAGIDLSRDEVGTSGEPPAEGGAT
jgi:hypothetical protein